MKWSEAGALTIFTLLFAVIAAPSDSDNPPSTRIASEVDLSPIAALQHKRSKRSATTNDCLADVTTSCGKTAAAPLSDAKCTPLLRKPDPNVDESLEKVFDDTVTLVNDQLTASMEYLLVGSMFNQWDSYRPGFQKYFHKMSDDAWDDAVAFIHHLTKRGRTPKISVSKPENPRVGSKTKELESLAVAYDKEMRLVSRTMELIGNSHKAHDPEMYHFLSEHLSDVRTLRVKHLANHVHSLYDAVANTDRPSGAGDASLAVHIYDTQILK